MQRAAFLTFLCLSLTILWTCTNPPAPPAPPLAANSRMKLDPFAFDQPDQTRGQAAWYLARALLRAKDPRWERGQSDSHRSLVTWALLDAVGGVHQLKGLGDRPGLPLTWQSRTIQEHVTAVLADRPTSVLGAAMQAEVLARLPQHVDGWREAAAHCTQTLRLAMRMGRYDAAGMTTGAVERQAPTTVHTAYGALAMIALYGEGVDVPVEDIRQLHHFLRWEGSVEWSGGRNADRLGATALAVAALGESAPFMEPKHRMRWDPSPAFDFLKEAAATPRDPSNSRTLPHPGKFDPVTAYYYQRALLWQGAAPLDWEWLRTQLARSEQEPAILPGWEDHRDIVIAAYSLLLIGEATRPVAFGKLNYGPAWDAHPRDVASLTEWTAWKLGKPAFRWRALDADSLDWEPVPVLVIEGKGSLNLSAAQTERLRLYIESGGLVLSFSDPAEEKFTASVLEVASRIVQKKYAFRALEPHHPLLSDKLLAEVRGLKVRAMTNGVRELWVHVDADLGATWQSRMVERREAFDLAANLALYATGRQITSPHPPLERSRYAPPLATCRIAVARVKYNGNWDPEPHGWRWMQDEAARKRIALRVRTVEPGSLTPSQTPLAHLVVSGPLMLPAGSSKALLKFVDDGGVLLVDAAGGYPPSLAVTNGFVATLIPDAKWDKRSTRDRTEDYRADSSYHDPAAIAQIVEHRRGKGKIIVSRGDLTAGLAGIKTFGIEGLRPEPARRVVIDLVQEAATKQ